MKRIGLRDLVNAALHRASRALLRLRLWLQDRLGLVNSNHPDPFHERRDREPADARVCRTRFEAFAALLPEGEALSVIDVGCSRGYFTFRMAERGGFCLGLDYDRNAIMAARAMAALHGVANAVFAYGEIDARGAAALPKADVVICLSVFHHWARKFGEGPAREIMAAVASRAGRYLVFETGQPDETEPAWAEALAFMRPDIDGWIRTFLTDLGFDEVREVGLFPSAVSATPRHLYVAMRKGPGR